MPEWFVKGGVVMWPLLVCSVAALAIILERTWALQRKRIIAADLVAEIQRQPRSADLTDKVRLLAQQDATVLGELARTALSHAWLTKSENVEAVQAMARQQMARLERGLTTLALVVELGPLLGLLGAVSGMVRVFGDVAKHGISDPQLISGGISEALIATFTGLAISIPALVAYMYLRRRIDILALEIERHVDELLKHLYH
jgi:biopolymer transport protein ExbB